MYIVILVLLVIFFMTFGLQLILGASRFIAGFDSTSGSNSTGNSNDTSVIVAPELYDIPDATSSAQLDITGRTNGSGTITIYVNDVESDSFEVDEDDPDFETTVRLNNGSNSIYAEYENEKGKIKDSDEYTVIYLKDKPTLDISSPSDGATYDKNEVTISGSVGDDINVKVNGRPVVVAADGSFRTNHSLSEGDNKITIIATDIAGNTTEEELTVKYEK